MEQLLWTFDDVVRFIHHPDRPVRRWALQRLTGLFPGQAGDAVVAMLDDEDDLIVMDACKFLAESGDQQRYGPVLLERLKGAEGRRFGFYAEALATLNHREALPFILAHLQRDTKLVDRGELYRVLSALGTFGGDEARQALWAILEQELVDEFAIGTAAGALLDAARPEDIGRLAQFYRSRSSWEARNRLLQTFAYAGSASRLAEEVRGAAAHGFEAALEAAKGWLQQEPQLSDVALDDLAMAFGREHEGVFPILLREARRLFEERGDDVTGWGAAWDAGASPVGYRRQALMTWLTLEAFAAHPAPDRDERRNESAMGLALLCQLSVDRDDQGRLEAAEDKTEMLLTILTEDRENVLPGIVDQVVALGPEIVPRLIAMFDPKSYGWGPIRIAEVIERMARRHPGSCDAAVPLLIEAVNDNQSDFLLEACESALIAIGLPAVEPIAQHIRDNDLARQIYLRHALGQIPAERSAQALLDAITESGGAQEFDITALEDIGSPTAIEPLYELWEPGDPLLAQTLLVLCEVNGVDRPELPEWRRLVRAEDERLARILRGEPAEPRARPVAAPPRPQLREHPRQRSKGPGKKELKKRAAQSRISKRKQKKKRKR